MIKLTPTQYEDVSRRVQIWTQRRSRAWWLARPTGWGKSYTALTAIEAMRQGKGRVLIVAEKSAIRQWVGYCRDLGLSPVGVVSGHSAIVEQRVDDLARVPSAYVITNYARLTLPWPPLFAVVFDEIERYLTNWRAAKRYKAAQRLQATYRVGLGATPLLRHPDRLWPILRLLEPE